jgi:hypothetical protein
MLPSFNKTGIAESKAAESKMQGSNLMKEATITDSDSSEWSTILEHTNALDRRLRLCLVFTDYNLQGQQFLESFPDWGFKCSPLG